jgi:hypothetical protein
MKVSEMSALHTVFSRASHDVPYFLHHFCVTIHEKVDFTVSQLNCATPLLYYLGSVCFQADRGKEK